MGAIVLGGALMRAFPLLYFGPSDTAIGYDEGVYFTAAAWVARGALPYRDFVFAHPPGFLRLWSVIMQPWSHADPAVGLQAARWITVAIGAANIAAVGALGTVSFGRVAGLAAAVLYAVSPHTVLVERGPLLEPTLNILCIGFAGAWLSMRTSRSLAFAAGACLAAAVCVKLWGALWVVAAIAAQPRRMDSRQCAALGAGAASVGILLAGPSIVQTSEALWRQAVMFQLRRPPDGFNRIQRLLFMINFRPAHLIITVGTMAGFVIVCQRGRMASAPQRFFAALWLMLLTLFLASNTFFEHYASHLMVPATILGGLAASVAAESLSRRRTALQSALLFAAIVSLGYTAARVLMSPSHGPWIPEIGRAVRARVPADASLLSFEPAWAVAGGRVETGGAAAPFMLDPYTDMLEASVDSGERFGDVTSALHSEPAQRRLRDVLDHTDFVILGARGRWQSSPETLKWITAGRTRIFPAADGEGIDIWERLAKRSQ